MLNGPIDRELSRDRHRGAILRMRLRWGFWECIELLSRLQQAGDGAQRGDRDDGWSSVHVPYMHDLVTAAASWLAVRAFVVDAERNEQVVLRLAVVAVDSGERPPESSAGMMGVQ